MRVTTDNNSRFTTFQIKIDTQKPFITTYAHISNINIRQMQTKQEQMRLKIQ